MTIILDKEYAKQKLRAALDVVDGLIAGDWPYDDSKLALTRIRERFNAQLTVLKELDENAATDVVLSNCRNVRSLIHQFKGFVGFILRSSNIRNAFESYDPIHSLAKKLLGEELHLILGSEWNYKPFAFPLANDLLNDYILIGLPASEAQNALLIPIAGHELGHAVWRLKPVGRDLERRIRDQTIQTYKDRWNDVKQLFGNMPREKIDSDFEAMSIWQRSLSYASRQCEEVFCDVLGTWIFGDAFSHAFRYLVAPEFGVRASNYYPTNYRRAQYFSEAASRLNGGISIPIADLFRKDQQTDDIYLELADEVTRELLEVIIQTVHKYCLSRKMKRPTPEGTESARRSLEALMPAVRDVSIPEITCAGWKIRNGIDEWNVPGMHDHDRKISVLNDIIFKSFEVTEWENRRLEKLKQQQSEQQK